VESHSVPLEQNNISINCFEVVPFVYILKGRDVVLFIHYIILLIITRNEFIIHGNNFEVNKIGLLLLLFSLILISYIYI